MYFRNVICVCNCVKYKRQLTSWARGVESSAIYTYMYSIFSNAEKHKIPYMQNIVISKNGALYNYCNEWPFCVCMCIVWFSPSILPSILFMYTNTNYNWSKDVSKGCWWFYLFFFSEHQLTYLMCVCVFSD